MRTSLITLIALVGMVASAAAEPIPNKLSTLSWTSKGITFTNLSNSAMVPQTNGTVVLLTDGSQTNPCTGGGSGALAVRLNGVWTCSNASAGIALSTGQGGNGITVSGNTINLTPPVNESLGSGAQDIDLSVSDTYNITLTANGVTTTTLKPKNGYDKERVTVTVCNNATGNDHVAWDQSGVGIIDWARDGGAPSDVTQAAGACDDWHFSLHKTIPVNTLREELHNPPKPSVVLLNSAAGTTCNGLARVNTSGQWTGSLTTDADGLFGVIVDNTCGTSGLGKAITFGIASCNFDGAVTAGDWVINSTTVATDCHDSGTPNSSVRPAVTVGVVVSPTHAGAALYSLMVGR